MIVETLIVPTSVVLVWNRISMVLKGYDYYLFNWYDVAGCVVNDDTITLVQHDINHLVINGTTLMPCYSLRNSLLNRCWVISKLESELAVQPVEEPEREVPLFPQEEEKAPILPSFKEDSSVKVEKRVPVKNRSEMSIQMLSSSENSSYGFSKRHHLSFNPNAVILGGSFNDNLSRTSSHVQVYSGDNMSESEMPFSYIPEVDIEEYLVC